MTLNTGPVALRYAQTRVHTFILGKASRLSDNFLRELNRRCPKLQRFGLEDVSDSSLSEAGVVRFIDGASSLVSLDIRSGLWEN